MQPFADQGPCPSSKLWFAFRMSDYDTGSGGDDGDDGGTDTLHGPAMTAGDAARLLTRARV